MCAAGHVVGFTPSAQLVAECMASTLLVTECMVSTRLVTGFMVSTLLVTECMVTLLGAPKVQRQEGRALYPP